VIGKVTGPSTCPDKPVASESSSDMRASVARYLSRDATLWSWLGGPDLLSILGNSSPSGDPVFAAELAIRYTITNVDFPSVFSEPE
jgi:hypothetical protein